jgi:hypothetical protein
MPSFRDRLFINRQDLFLFLTTIHWIPGVLKEQELNWVRYGFKETGYKTKQTPWPESASELYRPSDRRLLAKLVPTFADRGRHVVSVTDPYGRILGFLDRTRYLFFQAAPQLYSRGWVDLVPDSLLLRKSGSAGNRNRTPGSVAKYSDH